jgi:hypothetical protein
MLTGKLLSDLFIAAIFLSLAIFAKSWPLLLLPFFVVHVPGRKAKAVFLTVSLLPFLISVGILVALTPADIYYKLIRYTGLSGWWGSTSFYSVFRYPAAKFIVDLYASVGNYLLLLALGSMSLYYYKLQQSRSPSLLEALIGGILLVYVMMTGYGTQYMSWIAPLVIILSSTNKYARYFLVLASLELIIEYAFRPYSGALGEWVLKNPNLRSESFYASYASPRDIAITNLLRWPLWTYCGFFLLTIFRRWHGVLAECGSLPPQKVMS